MKKLLFTLAAASVMMVACKKKGAEEPTKTSEAAVAIIKGKALAELDNTSAGREDVPNGTTIVATVNRGGQMHRYESTVQNGEYTFSIPAPNTGITVSMSFSNFRSDVKISADPLTVSEDRIFGACDAGTTIHAGETQIIDFTWVDGGCIE
jgi:hypothetical protein